MKNVISTKLFLMLAIVAMIIGACTKENSDIPTGFENSSSTLNVDVKSGFITDMGIVPENPRHMLVQFGKTVKVFDDIKGEHVGTGYDISLNMFTDKDAHIPTGKYVYSESTDIKPFTFSSKGISVLKKGSYNELEMQSLSDGQVEVSMVGDDYLVTFSVKLKSGNTLKGTNIEKMIYKDFE